MALSAEKREDLNRRIEALRTAWSGYQSNLRARHAAYLRAFSPRFEPKIGEHDQWPDQFRPEDEGHTRSSFNMVRAAVELWTSLEASDFPSVRWEETYVPVPAPSMQESQNVGRRRAYRSNKAVEQHLTTTREHMLMRQVRISKLPRHFYRLTLKKNVYGQAWVRSIPDRAHRTFINTTAIDPSTVYPVWSAYGDGRQLDAVLVATRRSAAAAHAQYPEAVPLARDGITADDSAYYRPSADFPSDKDRAFVWVEDYWMLDAGRDKTTGEITEPRVLNAVRVNGKLVAAEEYPGWTTVPYFMLAHEDERDNANFSDVATMLPFQDGMNKMLSQQQDVIFGESRPRFKYRGDADRQIRLDGDQVISLDPDEDFEQVQVNVNTFPTQQHGQQLLQLMQRATGLPAVVWGEIQAAQNSGRALSTAWRATASRMVPRIHAASEMLDSLVGFWLDCMELYDWDHSKELYGGNRDFLWDFPTRSRGTSLRSRPTRSTSSTADCGTSRPPRRRSARLPPTNSMRRSAPSTWTPSGTPRRPRATSSSSGSSSRSRLRPRRRASSSRPCSSSSPSLPPAAPPPPAPPNSRPGPPRRRARRRRSGPPQPSRRGSPPPRRRRRRRATRPISPRSRRTVARP